MPLSQKESALRSQTIDWETFVSTYRPLPNPLDNNASYDGFMLETYGPEFDHVRAQPEANVCKLTADVELVIRSGILASCLEASNWLVVHGGGNLFGDRANCEVETGRTRI